MRSERSIKNLDDPSDRTRRDHHGPDNYQSRNWSAFIPPQRSRQLERILDIRRRCAGRHGVEVSLSQPAVVNLNSDLRLVVPVGLGASHTARQPADRNIFNVVPDRVLDFISHKENVLRTVNYVILTLFAILVVRTVLAVDLGSAAVALGVGSVPLILYFLKKWADERADRLKHYSLTSDRVFELAHKERQQADETARNLREEERAFQRQQIERLVAEAAAAQRKFENARRRSHAYSNALNGVVLIHSRLIESYEEAVGKQLPSLLKADRILDDLWRKIDQLDAEELGDDDLSFRRSGDHRVIPDDEDKS